MNLREAGIVAEILRRSFRVVFLRERNHKVQVIAREPYWWPKHDALRTMMPRKS